MRASLCCWGGGAAAVAADAPEGVTWSTLIANCPELAGNEGALQDFAEWSYDTTQPLPANLAACATAAETPAEPKPELPEGDAYPSDEAALTDYAEYIYNSMEDAANDAKAEADYLDKAEAEYNRLLAEAGEDGMPPKSPLEIFCEKNPSDPVCGGQGPEVPDPNKPAEEVEEVVVEATTPAPAEAAAPAGDTLAVTGTSAAALAGLALVLGLAGAGTTMAARRNA